ncbi:MAG: hypothetical protein D6715_08540 [Calditrichaeota bacterium]|nr:MAG: hypothetical protein D6715_08540 [Calditrichota bacterium]
MSLRLFEWEDFHWFPGTLRVLVTDVLRFLVSRLRLYRPAVAVLVACLKAASAPRIIDLGSGSGGPLPDLAPELSRHLGRPVDILLTDRFPPPRWPEDSPCRYWLRPLEATAVPPDWPGVRTLFNAFHHFPPEQAGRILQQAVLAGEPIAVFELVNRHPLTVALICLLPLVVWLVTPFIRPFSWQRLVWTYLLPVVPLVVWWDGLVSCFRVYSAEQLYRLARSIQAPGYRWRWGQQRRLGLVQLQYFVGMPESRKAGADPDLD